MAEAKKLNQKDFIKEAGTKIKYNDGQVIEITDDYKYLKKGMILRVHSIHAEAYIKQGIAKKSAKKVK